MQPQFTLGSCLGGGGRKGFLTLQRPLCFSNQNWALHFNKHFKGEEKRHVSKGHFFFPFLSCRAQRQTELAPACSWHFYRLTEMCVLCHDFIMPIVFPAFRIQLISASSSLPQFYSCSTPSSFSTGLASQISWLLHSLRTDGDFVSDFHVIRESENRTSSWLFLHVRPDSVRMRGHHVRIEPVPRSAWGLSSSPGAHCQYRKGVSTGKRKQIKERKRR